MESNFLGKQLCRKEPETKTRTKGHWQFLKTSTMAAVRNFLSKERLRVHLPIVSTVTVKYGGLEIHLMLR